MAPAPPEPWLEGLRGKHRQFFDVGQHLDGAVLGRTAQFLNVYRDAYGMRDSEVNVVFGAHGGGLALVLGDALWTRYKLGALYRVTDPATQVASRRNLYSGVTASANPSESVTALQARGVRFLACMRTIGRLARTVAEQAGEPESDVRNTIVAGLLPGVMTVPAMIVAVNRAQESGLSYVFLA
jgi:intracellular sulfur oxidation DsrE/DsrF family protein